MYKKINNGVSKRLRLYPRNLTGNSVRELWKKTYISIQTSLTVTVLVGLFFYWALGYLNSKKISNNKNYIVGNRDENTFSLTASLNRISTRGLDLVWTGLSSNLGRNRSCYRLCPRKQQRQCYFYITLVPK